MIRFFNTIILEVNFQLTIMPPGVTCLRSEKSAVRLPGVSTVGSLCVVTIWNKRNKGLGVKKQKAQKSAKLNVNGVAVSKKLPIF